MPKDGGGYRMIGGFGGLGYLLGDGGCRQMGVWGLGMLLWSCWVA